MRTISAVNISITLKNLLLLLLRTVNSVGRISYNNNNRNRTMQVVLIARENKNTKRRHRHVAFPCLLSQEQHITSNKKAEHYLANVCSSQWNRTAVGSWVLPLLVGVPALLSSLTFVAVFICVTTTNSPSILNTHKPRSFLKYLTKKSFKHFSYSVMRSSGGYMSLGIYVRRCDKSMAIQCPFPEPQYWENTQKCGHLLELPLNVPG